MGCWTGPSLPCASLDARVWRLLAAGSPNHPYAPARAPRGRFHRAEQFAAYASLSVEGAGVAVRRYASDGAGRVLVAMRLLSTRVADARAVPGASVAWHEVDGCPPSWAIADAARATGADAMLYRSRTRPDLTHVVVLRPGCLVSAGAPIDWAP